MLPMVGRGMSMGERLFRARQGGKTDDHGRLHPYPSDEMGAPPADRCPSGRANSRGIPVLYTASDIATAVAEIRPWKGAPVTVADVILNNGARVVDLVDIPGLESPFGRENLKADLDSLEMLGALGHQLSQPVAPTDAELEYVPTQYLAELIRHSGYDGIRYPSALGPGANVVLFDPTSATIANARLVRVTNVVYTTMED